MLRDWKSTLVNYNIQEDSFEKLLSLSFTPRFSEVFERTRVQINCFNSFLAEVATFEASLNQHQIQEINRCSLSTETILSSFSLSPSDAERVGVRGLCPHF
jgi:hypothetical protein